MLSEEQDDDTLSDMHNGGKMLKKSYKHLNTVQKGSFGEAFAKMAFTLEGFEVYASEYDDRGVDFVIRNSSGKFYSVQVKTTGDNANPFIKKDKFQEKDDFIFCAVRIIEGELPSMYIAKGSDWNNHIECECLKCNSEGGASGAYYEISFSNKYREQLARFEFQTYVNNI